MKKTTFVLILLTLAEMSMSLYSLEYTVKKGDTLFSIAKTYDISMRELIEINDLEDPGNIPEGMLLIIPSTYTANKGDTLYGIARKHHITVDELRGMNNLSADYMLKEGDVLAVPADVSTEQETKSTWEQSSSSSSSIHSLSSLSSSAYSTVVDPENALLWPIQGERFAHEINDWKGIRIKTELSQEVKSITSGTVVYADKWRNFPMFIWIETSDNYVYMYGGDLQSTTHLGDIVTPGKTIALINDKNDSFCYFYVYKDRTFIDPEKAPRE